MFSSEYCKVFKNTYFEEHLRTVASLTLWNPNLEYIRFLQLKTYVIFFQTFKIISLTHFPTSLIHFSLMLLILSMLLGFSRIVYWKMKSLYKICKTHRYNCPFGFPFLTFLFYQSYTLTNISNNVLRKLFSLPYFENMKHCVKYRNFT